MSTDDNQPAYRISVSGDDAGAVESVSVSSNSSQAIRYNEYAGRPALDWGPFSVAMVVSVVLLAMSAGVVFAAVTLSMWALLALVVTLPLTAMCIASGIGVLLAPRRYAASAQRVAMTEDKGWRTFGEM